jgi:hypothetical protein
MSHKSESKTQYAQPRRGLQVPVGLQVGFRIGSLTGSLRKLTHDISYL